MTGKFPASGGNSSSAQEPNNPRSPKWEVVICRCKHGSTSSEGVFLNYSFETLWTIQFQPSLTNTVITSAAVDGTWRAKDATRGTVLQLYYNAINSYFSYTWWRIQLIGYVHYLWHTTKHSLTNNNTHTMPCCIQWSLATRKTVDTVSCLYSQKKKTNRKSCMAYQMAWLPMTLSEDEGHFCCFNPL